MLEVLFEIKTKKTPKQNTTKLCRYAAHKVVPEMTGFNGNIANKSYGRVKCKDEERQIWSRDLPRKKTRQDTTK